MLQGELLSVSVLATAERLPRRERGSVTMAV